MLGTKSAAPQRANRFQTSQHADDSVIFPSVGNRVDVRTGAYRGSSSVAAGPARESVADGVGTHAQAGALAALSEPRARPNVRGCEDNARYRRSFRIGDGRELFDLSSQPILVDVKIHRGAPESGCRFQSL